MIVVLSGNPRPHSRTLHLAEEVGGALADRLGQPVPHTIDVAALGTRLLQSGDGVVADALGRLRRAGPLALAPPAPNGTPPRGPPLPPSHIPPPAPTTLPPPPPAHP